MHLKVILEALRDSLVANGGTENVAGYSSRAIAITCMIHSCNHSTLKVVEMLQMLPYSMGRSTIWRYKKPAPVKTTPDGGAQKNRKLKKINVQCPKWKSGLTEFLPDFLIDPVPHLLHIAVT